ncbi:hypothetical protein ASD51_10870 [Streptomyces sp. Root55]|nr:hypothetical protein ASD51_10870 [Streptomyces sp. Root55]
MGRPLVGSPPVGSPPEASEPSVTEPAALPATGRVVPTSLPPVLFATSEPCFAVESRVVPALSSEVRPPRAGVCGSTAAPATPAAPTTGAAPAAISSAARAIRRVRVRDMMLLRRDFNGSRQGWKLPVR